MGLGQDTPKIWAELLNENVSALPYLKPAVVRMLEELPGKDGLARTERQILIEINEGEAEIGPLFSACQKNEDAMFMGDRSFFNRLAGLANGLKPAIMGLGDEISSPDFYNDEDKRKAFSKRVLRLTDFGRALLGGTDDFASHNELDFWWGGTLVTDHDLWRWDKNECVLIFGG